MLFVEDIAGCGPKLTANVIGHHPQSRFIPQRLLPPRRCLWQTVNVAPGCWAYLPYRRAVHRDPVVHLSPLMNDSTCQHWRYTLGISLIWER